MLKKLRLLAAIVPVLAAFAPAQAAVISVSGLTSTSTNVGSTSLSSPSNYTYTHHDSTITDYSNTSTVLSEVAIPATTSAPGLIKDYLVTTEKYNVVEYSYKYDNVSAAVSASDNLLSGGKVITLSGSVTSTINTTIIFDLTAGGSYVPASSPFGGTYVPALGSLYLGSSLATIAPVSYSGTFTDTSAKTYTVDNGWSYSVNISAGQTLTFYAGVFAPDNASISYLSLNLQSDAYDYLTETTPYQNVTKTLIDAHPIPALSVPEPSTYAMLLAGMGMIGLVRRRRDRAGRA